MQNRLVLQPCCQCPNPPISHLFLFVFHFPLLSSIISALAQTMRSFCSQSFVSTTSKLLVSTGLQLMGLSGNKDAAVPHLLNYPFLLVTYRSICLVVTMLLAHWFGRIIHVPCLRWNKLTSCFTLAWRELVVMHNSCPRGLLSATLGPGWEWGQVFTGDINISSSGQWLSPPSLFPVKPLLNSSNTNMHALSLTHVVFM